MADQHEALSPVGKLAKGYAESYPVRALVALLPGGGVLDVLMHERVADIERDRQRTLADELLKGGLEITPELVQNDDFVHFIVATHAAAMRTRRHEKIRLFARLLTSALSTEEIQSPDEFEEYLLILEELSHRELIALALLEKYERTDLGASGLTAMQRAARIWDPFLTELAARLNVTVGEAAAVMTRLTRSGCYAGFAGESHPTGRGQLTPVYRRLKALVGGLDARAVRPNGALQLTRRLLCVKLLVRTRIAVQT